MQTSDMKNEVVIFCESYPQIKNTLYLISENYHQRPITLVITGYQDLLRFFKVINSAVFHDEINTVFFESYPARITRNVSWIRKAGYLFPDIVRERRYLQEIFYKYFMERSGDDIYFSGRCYNPSTYFLLKRLYRKNRVIYMPDPAYDVVKVLKSAPRNIIELAVWLRFKLAYGFDLMISRFTYQRNVPTMPDRFLHKRVNRIIDKEERDSLLQRLDMDKFMVFNEGDFRVMYFHQDVVESGNVTDAKAFESTMTGVFDTISKYYPDSNIARKYHPNSKSDKGMIKIGVIVPDYIPAEFLYNESIQLYLGLYSIALANVTRGLAVSLMDMVAFKNEAIREQLKKELLQWSKKEILFPKSLAEFEKILIDIKGTGKVDKLKEVK